MHQVASGHFAANGYSRRRALRAGAVGVIDSENLIQWLISFEYHQCGHEFGD
jgi:hypothetical protein